MNETISLYFCEAGSDKEYHADLVESGEGWVVNFRYGRRGSSLASGTKTKDPVAYDKAKKVYDKIVAEKMGKGYTTGESGAAYQGTPAGAEFTGTLPQLLNPVDESDLESLFRDSGWCMAVKHDGERRMASNVGGEWFGINRKGMRVALPVPVVEGLAGIPEGTQIDGEIIGDRLYVFDLMMVNGMDLRDRPLSDRYARLDGLLASIHAYTKADSHIKFVDAPRMESAKRVLFETVKASSGEGVVFKRWDSRYSPGRPNSGGDQLKFKFVEDATLVVEAQNDTKRSVQVAAFDVNGEKVLLGNVTIPPNFEVPEVGAIVSVQYLYAYERGCIYQPVYLGRRSDQDLSDCKLSQLKYKPMAEAA